MNLREYIRDVPDFPEPGIMFRDITPLLASPEAVSHVMETMAQQAHEFGAEVVVGIESRGFIFGMPLAVALSVPFVPVRKPGKLPSARMSVEYALEYGEGQLDIHVDAIRPGARVLIVDDLLATGGTARAAATLVELVGGVVAGLCFVVELAALQGRNALVGYQVRSQVLYP